MAERRKAAKELHMSPLTVQVMMKEKLLNIGMAVKKEGAQRYSYYIYRPLLDDQKKKLGLMEEEEE